jgi:hypothetical protein
MAVINKSYESVEVLANLGYRPKQTLIDKADSKYLTKLFHELDRTETSKNIEKTLKLSFIPLVLLSQYLLNSQTNPYLILLATALFLFLAIKIPGPDSSARPSAFFS